MSLPRSSSFRLALAALAACSLLVVAPAAVAAPGSGKVTLTVGDSGKAAQALVGAGVSTAATAPAKKRGKRITLPVQKVAVGKSATVGVRGGLRFKAAMRVLALRAVRLTLKPRRAAISAKVGKRRVTVFAAALPKGKAKLDRDDTTAKLVGAKLALTPNGARLLSSKLGVDGVVAGPLGKLGVDAKSRDDGNPRSGPLGKAPAVKARPATAVDVSGISIVWYPRDSWVRYLSSGVGSSDGIFASAGATALPASDTASHPCSDASYSGSGNFDYGFRFTAKSGWYDPPTGDAALYGDGSVRFVWKGHGIDLAAADPEIEIDGASSRVIFEFTGKGGTAYARQRADFVNLDLAGQPTVAGNTRTYSAVRGRLTESGQAVFAGFYPPPTDNFGCVSVAFTTP
jgi:Htaa